MNTLNLPLTFLLTAASLPALQPKPTLSCNNHEGDRNRGQFCEMREQTVSASSVISVEASPNGGISIKGWDRPDVLVRAQVHTNAPTDDQAKDLARQINVQSAGPQVKAYGPPSEKDRSWSVTYEVFVPSRSSVNLETVNGGVSISDVNGNLEFKTVNGGVSLQRVAGNVRGKTTNGGVSIELAGDRWDGQGLDVTTTNGGVNMKMPRNYSAQFEAQTHNGGIHADVPQVQAPSEPGRRPSHISTVLGGGGAPLKVSTMNGGVNVTRI